MAIKLSTLLNASSNLQLAKAWVNFNGTGTPAIRSSFNVSSITKLGTGSYQVNLVAGAVADANYSAVATATAVGVANFTLQAYNYTVNYVGVVAFLPSSLTQDVNPVSVQVFGN